MQYVEQGNWDRALETAATHGPEVLHKYVALCATQLIRDEKPQEALNLYKKHGAPAFAQNYNIYKRIAVDLFASPYKDTGGVLSASNDYAMWSGLRDMVFEVTENLAKGGETEGMQAFDDFQLLLLISHYLAVRSACQTQKALKELSSKVAVALLRHSDVIPADKAFYEAGMAAKEAGWLNMAFVFLNR